MKASFTKPAARSKFSQLPITQQVYAVTVIDGKPVEFADVRFLQSARGDGMRPLHCSAWFHHLGKLKDEAGRALERSGTGKASGCGYCKRSAAFEDALSNAGIAIDKNIGGAGMSAVRDALRAIGELAGFDPSNILILGD